MDNRSTTKINESRIGNERDRMKIKEREEGGDWKRRILPPPPPPSPLVL